MIQIIDSFEVLLDSGEFVIIHQVQALTGKFESAPTTGRSYLSEYGDLVYEMVSGEFVVMCAGSQPQWGRRVSHPAPDQS